MKASDVYKDQLDAIQEYISLSTHLTRQQLLHLQTSEAFASPKLQAAMDYMVTETIDQNVQALADHIDALNLPPNQKLCAQHPQMGLLALQGFGFSTETSTYVALVNDKFHLPMQEGLTLTIDQRPANPQKV